MKKTKKSFFGLLVNAAIVAISLALTLSAIEVYLRYIGFSPRVYNEHPWWTGPNNRARGTEFTYRGGEVIEFETRGKWNSQGFPDREYAFYKKEKNVFRIIVLGDSYTEALQVDPGKSFHKIIERKMNEKFNDFGKKIEVISMGQSGNGQIQEYRLLRERGLQFKPDLVLMEFNSSNDIGDNYPKIRNEGRDESKTKGKLISRKKINQGLLLFERSYANNFIGELIADFAIELIQFKSRNLPREWLFFAEGDYKDIEKGWSITKEYILKIKYLCENKNIGFMIFTKNVRFRNHGWREWWRYKDIGNYNFNFDKPYNLIAEFCRQQSIPMVDVSKPINDYVKKNGARSICWKFDSHWNEVGHKLAGEKIFEFLDTNRNIVTILTQ